ncbi:MAG: chemotaxis protein CheD [Novosphingobium sp.]
MFQRSIIDPPALTRITVLQGQARVSAGPRVVFTTVLGSCVATCLFDPQVEIGGMNHFLLAEPARPGEGKVDEHYGVYLMEVLINEMMAQGASKQRLRAHLYGGANLHAGMARIGTMNAEFARNFLIAERIPLVREDLGGLSARRVDFRPALGQVRVRHVESAQAPEPVPPIRTPPASGDVELF